MAFDHIQPGDYRMVKQLDSQGRPDVTAGEPAIHELVKRVLKLRWMG